MSLLLNIVDVDNMDEIFIKMLDLYNNLLLQLSIGYQVSSDNFSELWELMHVREFINEGYASEDELLWISDKYETISATITDFDEDEE